MFEDVENFKSWYSEILKGLYGNPNSGLVILMVAFPLLERYLREKSGVHERTLDDSFYDEFRGVFPMVSTEAAKQLWQAYRNGLLHQATLSQERGKEPAIPGAYLASSFAAIEVGPDGALWVNPEAFAKTVIKTVEADFGTFRGTHSPNHTLPFVVVDCERLKILSVG